MKLQRAVIGVSTSWYLIYGVRTVAIFRLGVEIIDETTPSRVSRMERNKPVSLLYFGRLKYIYVSGLSEMSDYGGDDGGDDGSVYAVPKTPIFPLNFPCPQLRSLRAHLRRGRARI